LPPFLSTNPSLGDLETLNASRKQGRGVSTCLLSSTFEDLGDARDPEVHRICLVDSYGDPRQAMLRLARAGAIPSTSWNGKRIFHKPTLRRPMAARFAGQGAAVEEVEGLNINQEEFSV